MRVIRAANYQAVPWKNGLGTTHEILKHPESVEDFIYRLSIAEVTQSCAFSAFPGYDRTITLLDGDGFELRFADGGTHALDSRHAPFHFDGGMSVSCTVTGGPSKDLNLMVRREAARADCGMLEMAGRLTLPPVPGATRLIVALAEGITVRDSDQAAALGRWDTVCIEMSNGPADETICESAGAALFFHALVTPRAGAA